MLLLAALLNVVAVVRAVVPGTPRFNFINLVCTDFARADPESVKRY